MPLPSPPASLHPILLPCLYHHLIPLSAPHLTPLYSHLISLSVPSSYSSLCTPILLLSLYSHLIPLSASPSFPWLSRLGFLSLLSPCLEKEQSTRHSPMVAHTVKDQAPPGLRQRPTNTSALRGPPPTTRHTVEGAVPKGRSWRTGAQGQGRVCSCQSPPPSLPTRQTKGAVVREGEPAPPGKSGNAERWVQPLFLK